MLKAFSFCVANADLLPVVRAAAAIVSRKAANPVLTHLLLTVAEDSLTVAAGTEVDQVRSVCPCRPETGNGSLTVPALQFQTLLQNLPEDAEIRLEAEAKSVTLTAGTTRMKLTSCDPQAFPVIVADDLPVQITLPASRLKKLLSESMFAMAQNDVRSYLNGMLFEAGDNSLTLVATDSYRLVRIITQADGLASESVKSGIVPRSAVIQLLKMLPDSDDTAVIGIGAEKAVFSWLNSECVTTLLTGRYPDYRRVIPNETDNPFAVTFNREDLIRSVSRTALFADEKRAGMKLELADNTLTLSCAGPNFEYSTFKLPCDWSGEPVEIAYNYRYLLDALSAVKTADVELRFGNSRNTLLIRKTGEEAVGFDAIIMPMHL